MVKFYETKHQLKIEEIEAVEQKLNFTFPGVYKQHLLQYNGGRCEPNIVNFIEEGKPSSSDLDWFLDICNEPMNNLVEYFTDFKITYKRMPSSIFPFAHDSGGNQYCMDADDGKIYFWDHEKEVDYSVEDDSVRDNLYFVANSWEEFLNNITEDNDEEE